MHWDDGAKTLTLGDQQGNFTGMLKERTFRLVLVGKDHGTGIGESESAEATVVYKGAKMAMKP